MSSSSSNDISSVKPTVAASEGTSAFGDQRDHDREESQKYKGVEKIKNGSIYIGHVRDNDHATESERTIYLGKFNKDENAARAHDLVALKLGGSSAKTNFPESQYKKAREAMVDMTQKEVVDTVRGHRREEAARAYDVESIKLKGKNAITNFNIKCYNVDAILKGETDEKVIYQSRDIVAEIVETSQPFQVLESIIGKDITTMLYGIGNKNEEGEKEHERLVKIKEEANVALASQDEDEDE
ncbi:hypothetical protein VNO77_17146 [Canavalia gladiata]|uniref:AP2/ERF domain-containing protein n=1 Tax=Canavalia gladiata TaxID=3824 RepID=A0AAN9LIF9_CANGL